MKKIYITPEMEILDTELEGFLASSLNSITENGDNFHSSGGIGARQGGDGFDDFDEFEEDDY